MIVDCIAAANETLEETGVVDPRRLELQVIVNTVEIHQIAVAFRMEVATLPAIVPGPGCLEAVFMAEVGAPANEFAWCSYLGNATRRWFKEMRSSDYSIYLAMRGSDQRCEFESRVYKIKS